MKSFEEGVASDVQLEDLASPFIIGSETLRPLGPLRPLTPCGNKQLKGKSGSWRTGANNPDLIVPVAFSLSLQ
jgi:hypothetical protein